ncbi:NPR1/NH1-interacting protein [Arabidopsis thaliana x Arabidopsis arenosa]|uniref:NPR1/NH1-interacting protein n=1 Tax=Arabidopsis thaliana x Arabidopsis arenosa TaxID=1240361 RepID=A0A8T1Z342_9BRAS|nr:NPR1/NH1-interacting protein [Arabidopsis thaliana x Arabidopsis arenosa]
MAIMNQEEENTEKKRINEIDEDEEEELENKKMEMFFNLIKNYQDAKKRRRQDLTQDSGDTASVPTKRSDYGIVPVFRAEDFSHCMDLNLKPSNSFIPTKNQEEEKQEDEEEDEEEGEEDDDEEEEVEKVTIKDNGLDLNLAL